jgi:hypothetical protein
VRPVSLAGIGPAVLIAQIVLVVVAFIGAIYRSVWWAVPPLVLAYVLTAARMRRR